VSGKLVRDRIPEIMRAAGETPIVRHNLTAAEIFRALRDKLDEEIAEYDRAQSFDEETAEYDRAQSFDEEVDELADILEVVYAIARDRGIDRGRVESHRRRKLEDRGGFSQGVWLVID
jgi:predicted house-cleaning noncanonical NTP pyrophosphatase (MazG superfamily)